MTVLDASLATDLVEAASRGDVQNVLTLLRAGVVPSTLPPGYPHAALHAAAERGHSTVVEALLAQGCPVDLADSSSTPALSYVIHAIADSRDSKDRELLTRVVLVLLRAGACPKSGRTREDAPLVLARAYELTDIENMLLPYCTTSYFPWQEQRSE